MKVLCYDTETTGLDPKKSAVLSLGAILYDTETKESKEFYRVFDWTSLELISFEIPEAVSKINGITIEYLKENGISPIKGFCEFYEFLINNLSDVNENLDIVSAWNLPFDLNMIKSSLLFLRQYNKDYRTDAKSSHQINRLIDIFTKNYRKNNVNHILFIDPRILDKIYHPVDKDGNKLSHAQNAVSDRYGLKKNENAHNAIYDTRTLLEIWKIQYEELKSLNVSYNSDLEDVCIIEYKNLQEEYKKKQGDNHYSNNELDYFGYFMEAAEL